LPAPQRGPRCVARLLAPDIQEEILTAEVEPGHDPINEHTLRWVVRARDWPTQRARWRDLNSV